jgi:hypothetical protein
MAVLIEIPSGDIVSHAGRAVRRSAHFSAIFSIMCQWKGVGVSSCALVLALLVLLYGCHGRVSAANSPTPDSTPAEEDLTHAEITIVIANHNLLDMTIYLVRGGNLERVGNAPGLSTKVFSLPWRRVDGRGEVRLAADPIGQNSTIRTEYLIVRPGSVVEWTIENVLTQSVVSVH